MVHVTTIRGIGYAIAAKVRRLYVRCTRFARSNSGATAIEYALLAASISVPVSR